MAYTKYSLTPADNNAAPPNGAPEGMLPSAVNDTMRDMMAQIRDVGDGIRGGTYTMTAPVITGGSITGVALSGNTLTNPVITGGSINNTPIGASTANTGAFTTLGASSTATLNTLVSSGATITGGTISGVSLSATSPNFTTPVLGTPTSGTLTNCTGLPVATGVSGLGSNVATFLATPSSANLASAVTDETGTGSLVFATSPALTTPNLGTPSAATLTNATGLPVATGISGLGTGVATFLATPSSANLRTAVTDETGSGALVFATSPTLVTPVLGVATATSVQGIIGNVTPAAGTFTTLTANGNTTLGDAAGDITTVPDLKALQVTSADRHSVRPSLLLDFANTKTLDPRITFTRASTGTFYDGKTVAKAEENLVTFSNEISTATWVSSGVSTTVNNAVAPDGTTTATLLTASAGADSRIRLTTTQSVSTTNTYSVYAKAGASSWLRLRNIASNDCSGWFNLTTGVVGTVSGGTSAITSVGSGWYRCSITSTSAASIANNLLDMGAPSGDNTQASAGGETIYVWGIQLEARSTATALTVTTTAPITNYIPALQSAASGVARFEHNPVTGESLGLEIEEQRTNLALRSDDFANAAWSKSEATVTSNTIVAPDGTLTGDAIVENTATDTHSISNVVSYGSNNAVSISVFAKTNGRSCRLAMSDAASGAASAFFDLTNGVVFAGSVTAGGLWTNSSASIQNCGNGWFRCVLTATKGAGTDIIGVIAASSGATATYTGNGFSGIYIWGAQLEAGAFATSYIPTVASQVTRSADAASMTGTNFSSWYRADEGTLYGEVVLGASTADKYVAQISDNSSNNRHLIGGTNNPYQVVVSNGSTTVASNASGSFSNTTAKVSTVYKINDFAIVANSGTPVTDTSGALPVNASQINLGTNNNATGNFLNGSIKKIAYYPKRLTNAELQGLTTV